MIKRVISTFMVVAVIALLSTQKVFAVENSVVKMESKLNVSLDEVLTVKLPDKITKDKIDGVVIENGSDFVPVTATLSNDNEVNVKPVHSYAGNSKYFLKVFLNDGKKYIMDFTTKKESREADKEPNNSYLNANTVVTGESITGNIGVGDDTTDWYKLELGKDGRLDLKLTHNNDKTINVIIYGKDGNSGRAIYNSYDYSSKSIRSISTGLAGGTYYIAVESKYDGNYKMDIDFKENNDTNDICGNYSYLNSSSIKEDDTVIGHIGYLCDDDTQDTTDWYKLIVSKDGIMNINLKHNNDEILNFVVYDKNGQSDKAIYNSYDYSSKSIVKTNLGLSAGTYYVRVESKSSGSYTLSTKLYKNSLLVDKEDNDQYINAVSISPKQIKTGHIGFTYDDGNIDDEDWYKVVIAKIGTLSINLKSNVGQYIDFNLYNVNAHNDNAIFKSYDYSSKSIQTTSKTLKAGTYYINVHSKNPQGYTLTTSFK